MFNKKVAVLVALVIIVSAFVAGCTTSTTRNTSNLSSQAPSGITLPPGSLTRNPVIAGMIETMNETNMYNTTDTLQRIPTRLYGTAGNVEAADLLYSKLSGIPRLKVEYEDGSYKNIIGILPGTNTSSEDVVMVGAHYDSISSGPKAPGATDDACGDAIVLELARVMSQHQFNHTIAFALWNDEEGGQKGSNMYAESAAQSSQKIPLYVNFDSSCYDPTNNFTLDIMYNSQSSLAAELMTHDNTLYGTNFTLTYNVHTCGADYLSFWSHGYPAVMTHSETHGPQHTPSDTIDKVSFAYALKNGQLGMAVLAQIAEVQRSAPNT
jgi:Zn-dependent M28 family amino/carboxypeptidase